MSGSVSATTFPHQEKMPKKKLKQLKLKQAFPRNFQKYPIKKCVWDADLQDHVYEPPKYTKEFTDLERAHAHTCKSCYLRPCVMEGKKLDFMETLKECHEDPEFAIEQGRIVANNLLFRYFGKIYMRRWRKSDPDLNRMTCIGKALPKLLAEAVAEVNGKLKVPGEEETEEEEYDDDDEEEEEFL